MNIIFISILIGLFSAVNTKKKHKEEKVANGLACTVLSMLILGFIMGMTSGAGTLDGTEYHYDRRVTSFIAVHSRFNPFYQINIGTDSERTYSMINARIRLVEDSLPSHVESYIMKRNGVYRFLSGCFSLSDSLGGVCSHRTFYLHQNQITNQFQ